MSFVTAALTVYAVLFFVLALSLDGVLSLLALMSMFACVYFIQAIQRWGRMEDE